MYLKTFNGYNCFSSAIGEYTKYNLNDRILDLIQSQWVFLFDKDLFWNNLWYVGASLKPVDNLLVQDLKQFTDITVSELTATKTDALCQSKEVIRRDQAQIILVDFYYLESVNWKSMRRFKVYPQHDAHFIILTAIEEDMAVYIDPYYSYQGVISLTDLAQARNHETKQAVISYHSYEIVNNYCEYDLKKAMSARFRRFLSERMYYKMEEFAIEVDRKRLIEGKMQNRNWAMDGYNSLRSIVEQRSNLLMVQKKYNLALPEGLQQLEDGWAQVRKLLFEFYYSNTFCLDRIAYEIFELSALEKEYAVNAVNIVE